MQSAIMEPSAATGPPIFRSAVIAWRDAFIALAKMPTTLGIAMVAVFVVNIAITILALTTLVPTDSGLSIGLAGYVGMFISGIADAFLMTPAAIAVHRHVLLGEVTHQYRLSPRHPRFQRFLLFALIFQLLGLAPPCLIFLGIGFSWLAALVLVGGVLSIATMIVCLRVLILFPAIAVDAPGAEWRNASRDTQGHFWRVFFIVVCVGIPAFIIYITFGEVLGWLRDPGVARVVQSAAQSVYSVLLIAAYAAAASRLYLAFGERLGRPPEIAIGPA